MLYTYQARALPLKPYILATSLANPIRLNEHDVECCFRLSASAQPWRLHQLHPGQQHWSCFRSSMAHLGTAQQPGAYFSCPYMPIPYIVPIRSDKYSLGILLFTTVLKTPNPHPQATVPGRMSACDRLPCGQRSHLLLSPVLIREKFLPVLVRTSVDEDLETWHCSSQVIVGHGRSVSISWIVMALRNVPVAQDEALPRHAEHH